MRDDTDRISIARWLAGPASTADYLSNPVSAILVATSSKDNSAVLGPDRAASKGLKSRRASKVVPCATGMTRSVEHLSAIVTVPPPEAAMVFYAANRGASFITLTPRAHHGFLLQKC